MQGSKACDLLRFPLYECVNNNAMSRGPQAREVGKNSLDAKVRSSCGHEQGADLDIPQYEVAHVPRLTILSCSWNLQICHCVSQLMVGLCLSA